jgi:hypothetical protein
MFSTRPRIRSIISAKCSSSTAAAAAATTAIMTTTTTAATFSSANLRSKESTWVPSQKLIELWPDLIQQWNDITLLSTTTEFSGPTSIPTTIEYREHHQALRKPFPLFPPKKATVASSSAHDDSSTAAAAVLVILCCTRNDITHQSELSVLLTQRATTLNTHGGEISFPGGKVNHNDNETVIDAAVRETIEELCPINPTWFHHQHYDDSFTVPPLLSELLSSELPRSSHASAPLTILGTAQAIPSINGTPVTPVIAIWWPNIIEAGVAATSSLSSSSSSSSSSMSSTTTTTTTTSSSSPTYDVLQEIFPANPHEVSHVVTIPVTWLVQNETSLLLPKNRFGLRTSPCYPIPPYMVSSMKMIKKTKTKNDDDHETNVDGIGTSASTPTPQIWGLTAYILQPLLRQWLVPVVRLSRAKVTK